MGGEDDQTAGLILGETTDVLDVSANPFSDLGGSQQQGDRLFEKRGNKRTSKKRNSRKSRSNSIDARNAARVKRQLRSNPLAKSRNKSVSNFASQSPSNEGEYKEEKRPVLLAENKSEESTPREEVEPDGSESGSVSESLKDEEQERLQELERIREEEKKLRELSFREEESRVRKGVDGFVPHPVTQVAPARKN